jgi:hypothetical protein
MIVIVPLSGSESTIVSGIRSPFSSMSRTMNWPALRFLAMAGASRIILTTFSDKATFSTILFKLLSPDHFMAKWICITVAKWFASGESNVFRLSRDYISGLS